MAHAHPSGNDVIREAMGRLAPEWSAAGEIEYVNQRRVLEAFQEAGVGSHDLQGSTGYGYGDTSRARLEEVYARVFQGESALVRPQIASGTHALWLCLDALLQRGDRLVSASGPPYDTLRSAILGSSPQSLVSKGIYMDEVDLAPDGTLDLARIEHSIREHTRLLFVQRSKGYAWRPAVSLSEIKRLCRWRDEFHPRLIVMVDNCYGEFVEPSEPCGVGVDVAAGSLIKNPGGTLAPGGGYIVGRSALLETIAERMTAPGLGRNVGPSYGVTPTLLQGVFVAPHFVHEAVCGMMMAAWVLERLGLRVLPRWDETRGDTVQAVRLGTAETLRAFCQTVQEASPVDSYVRLEAGPLPGYKDPVVMAAGTFVQGASSELSADGPMREPYIAYLQGGTSRAHIRMALERIWARSELFCRSRTE